jgi:hypothetical protein
MLWGQSSSGTITGRVVDTSGGAVARAEVRAINQIDKTSRSFTTNASGDFVFTDLGPGSYTLLVKAAGFKQFEKTDLQLTALETLAAGDLRLQVGQVTETVEVKASAATVETASGDRSALLDSKEITDLMARGRDIMAMLQILPGVANDATGNDVLGQFSTPTIDGGRSFYNAVNIDGISGNTARGRTAESPINLDAIAEVKVLTNSFTAEYGTATSGVINLVTKSGTQTFHGGVYYYLRNEDLNANDFFANRQGLPRSRYRFNTTGGFLGGPVYIPKRFNTSKQKLFFFFSIEDDPNVVPNSVRNYTVPTALERQGDFSQSVNSKGALISVKDPTTGQPFPGNIIPANRIDANSSKLLSVFPLPNALNTAVTGFAYNFQISGSEKEPVKQEILKLDYNISEKAKVWLRASGFTSDNTGLTSPAIDNQWGPVPVDYRQTMPNLGANFTYVFTPTLVNEATLGMNLWTETQPLSGTALSAYQRANYGINIPQSYPSDNPFGLLPAVAFGSAITNGVAITYDGRFPLDDNSTNWSFSDGLSKVAGRHVFKAGFHYEHVLYNQYHQAGGNGFPGSFNFQTDTSNPNDTGYAYANAILGNYDTYSEATNRVNYAPITRILEWYVQDHIRVTNRFTVDIGLRFTDALPESPANNNAGNFDPAVFVPSQAPALFRPEVVNGAKVVVNPLTGAVVPNVYSGLIVPNTGNILNGIITPTTPGFPRAMVYSNGILPAPRLGFAWDPFGDGKTAIRGGGGIFYTNRLDAGTLGNLFFNPPAIFNPTEYYGTVATAANTSGLLSPSTFSRDIDPHAKTVTAYQVNFGIQREIGFGTVLDVAYVGNFGRHLGEVVQLNEVPFGAEFLPQNQNPQTNTPLSDNYFRPYPGYNGVSQQIYQGNSSYHSLQVQLHRRISKYIYYGVVYTFSKAMDYGEGDSTSTSGGPPNASDTVATYLNRATYNYGLAGYNRPNILTFHFLYDVPRVSRLLPNPVVKALFDGWQVSDITTFESGAPQGISFTESPGVNFLGGGDGARTLMVANPTLPSGQRSFNEYFNTAAFAEPTPMSPSSCTVNGCPAPTLANLGDAPESPVIGPGVSNWNTSLYKNFTYKEKVRLQFRAEAYNTFNHTQYSTVGSSITYNAAGQNTNTQFGQITATRNPRYMQLALRVIF